MIENLIWSPRGSEKNDQIDDWTFEEGPHFDFAGPTSRSTDWIAKFRGGLELPNPSEFTLNGFVGQVHCLIDDNNLLFAGLEKSGTRDGKGKQKRKTFKFHKVRLGDGSVEAFLDLKSANHDPDPSPNIKDSATSSGPNMESLPAHGVWQNGGGQKLLMTSNEPKK